MKAPKGDFEQVGISQIRCSPGWVLRLLDVKYNEISLKGSKF